jgi:hypothetical protein
MRYDVLTFYYWSRKIGELVDQAEGEVENLKSSRF